jgi:hypothetical protein
MRWLAFISFSVRVCVSTSAGLWTDEVHALDAHAAEGLLDLPHALVPAVGPDLGRHEELVAQAELRSERADDRFGCAVHGRRVDHAAARRGERLEHFAQRRSRGGIAAHVEGLPRPDADGGQLLPRGRDALQHDAESARPGLPLPLQARR